MSIRTSHKNVTKMRRWSTLKSKIADPQDSEIGTFSVVHNDSQFPLTRTLSDGRSGWAALRSFIELMISSFRDGLRPPLEVSTSWRILDILFGALLFGIRLNMLNCKEFEVVEHRIIIIKNLMMQPLMLRPLEEEDKATIGPENTVADAMQAGRIYSSRYSILQRVLYT